MSEISVTKPKSPALSESCLRAAMAERNVLALHYNISGATDADETYTDRWRLTLAIYSVFVGAKNEGRRV